MPTLDELAKAGIIAINERKYDEAVKSFEAALEIDPNRPDINSALGMAHLHRGEAGSAIDYLEKAVALSEPFDAPEHQEMKLHFRVGLASAYEMADRISDARVVVGAVAARPLRLANVEQALAGRALNEETATMAGELAIEGAVALRQNAYKIPLMRNLVRRAIRGGPLPAAT